MPDTALKIAQLATDLVAFSPVALKLSQVIDDKTSSAETISEIIKQDVALTTNILRLANSPFYGFSQDISSIGEAVSRVGTTEVFQLALSISARETFPGIPEKLISMEDFWSHSILCAYASQELITTFNLSTSGSIYAAGLLHDIGQLILFENRPEQATEVLERCLGTYEESDQSDVENEVFGFTHADVGLELARMWNFPPLLQECIAFHHRPNLANKFEHEARIINMSNVLAVLVEIQSHNLNDAFPIDDSLREAFNKNLSDIGAVCRRIEEKYNQNKHVILGAML